MNENDILIKLNNSKFRSSFKLKETDFDYIKKKGIKKVEEHAYDFITNRLGSSNPKMMENKHLCMVILFLLLNMLLRPVVEDVYLNGIILLKIKPYHNKK